MKAHHLLYIDILGFADLTKTNPAKVENIFSIVTKLRKIQSDAFEILIFSDTILVKNQATVTPLDNQKLCIMSLCQFAAMLQYRLSNLDVFFRAVLLYGPFHNYKEEGVDCFYGQALIDAYNKEKNIKCVGLFLSNSIQKHPNYPTIRHDDNLVFTYLSESLEEHNKNSGNGVILDRSVLENACYYLFYDVKYLSQLYEFGHKHKNPDIRIKFLSAFNYYEQRYPILVRALVDSQFDPKIICEDYDWNRNLLDFDLPQL